MSSTPTDFTNPKVYLKHHPVVLVGTKTIQRAEAVHLIGELRLAMAAIEIRSTFSMAANQAASQSENYTQRGCEASS